MPGQLLRGGRCPAVFLGHLAARDPELILQAELLPQVRASDFTTQELAIARDGLGDLLRRALALPYRDQPDYQQEWGVIPEPE